MLAFDEIFDELIELAISENSQITFKFMFTSTVICVLFFLLLYVGYPYWKIVTLPLSAFVVILFTLIYMRLVYVFFDIEWSSENPKMFKLKTFCELKSSRPGLMNHLTPSEGYILIFILVHFAFLVYILLKAVGYLSTFNPDEPRARVVYRRRKFTTIVPVKKVKRNGIDEIGLCGIPLCGYDSWHEQLYSIQRESSWITYLRWKGVMPRLEDKLPPELSTVYIASITEKAKREAREFIDAEVIARGDANWAGGKLGFFTIRRLRDDEFYRVATKELDLLDEYRKYYDDLEANKPEPNNPRIRREREREARAFRLEYSKRESNIRLESTKSYWQVSAISLAGGWDYYYSSEATASNLTCAETDAISAYATRFTRSKSLYVVGGFKRSIPLADRKAPESFITTINDDGEYITKPIPEGLKVKPLYTKYTWEMEKRQRRAILEDEKGVNLSNNCTSKRN